jgi:hypothetical protein
LIRLYPNLSDLIRVNATLSPVWFRLGRVRDKQDIKLNNSFLKGRLFRFNAGGAAFLYHFFLTA